MYERYANKVANNIFRKEKLKL